MKAGAELEPGSEANPGTNPVAIGCLGLIGLAILDFAAIAIGGSRYCGTAPGWTYVVLLLVPVVVASGAIGSLVIARRRVGLDGELRKRLRTFGVIAIIFTFLSGIVNLVAAFLSSFCLP